MQLKFRHFCIILSLIFTFSLIVAIASLFIVPSPSEIIDSMRSAEMIYSLKLTLITSSISTVIVIFTAIPMSYALSRYSFWGKSIVKSIIDLPMAFPELVLGLALLLLFGKTAIGSALSYVGINIVFTKLGIVVAQVFTALPFATRIAYTTFESINPRYELVSRTLGYGEFETFKNVTLPLAKDGILASTIITFARCVGAFGAVLILAGGSYMNTEVLPVTLYLNISYGNIGMAITSGIVLIIVSFIAIYAFEKLEGAKNVSKNRKPEHRFRRVQT
ncbi:MAG: ABC transporter permease subunit [Euryarchaeota archaeon]|nr:ABC transporter permease subunit [Euryarchaeota archaeon]